MKQVLKSGDEQDALTWWHHYLTWRPGERKEIKRRVNRRARRDARADLREASRYPEVMCT